MCIGGLDSGHGGIVKCQRLEDVDEDGDEEEGENVERPYKNVSPMQYYEQLIRNGEVSGFVLLSMAEILLQDKEMMKKNDVQKRVTDLITEAAVEYNDGNAVIKLYDGYKHGHAPFGKNITKAVNVLLEADKRGLVDDDRILGSVIQDLMNDKEDKLTSLEIVQEMKTKEDVIVHYCDVLIGRQLPKGYHYKASIYMSGIKGVVERDLNKAIQICQQAEKEGMAVFNIYSSLAKAYEYVRYHLVIIAIII